jgi:hypothetical protein
MRVSIAYSVPVQVIVDLDSGEVDRVVVIDEGIEADKDGFSEDADEYRPITAEQKARAYEIADGGAEWPSWDFGW